MFYAVLIVFLRLRPEILGRWTKKGRIRHEKMLRYRKFMEDLTLLSKKELKEIIFWDKHLVYATAFGIQDKVMKAIKFVEPDYSYIYLILAYRLVDSSLFFLNLVKMKTSFISLLKVGISRGGFGAGKGGGGGGGGAR